MNFSNGHFYSASDFYKEKFGCKIYKISLSSGCTCPNRDGTKGKGGCIFCSEKGSGDFSQDSLLPIKEQIQKAKLKVKDKNKNGKFIAYFQSFTNTYGNPENLEKKFNDAVLEPDISGISIATRPDCLDDEIMKVLKRISKKTFLTLELGLQTGNDQTGQILNRCYTSEDFKKAVEKIHKEIPEAHVITHLIIGLPGENLDIMKESVNFAVKCKTDGIKLSLLHVLKETALEKLYYEGKVPLVSLEEYCFIISELLKVIPANVVVHRITGDGPKSILISPLWTGNKKLVLNTLQRYFDEENVIQGAALQN